jgi:uncharacterized protein YrrD
MKKTQEVLGLSIITISDGAEVGRVKSILINAENGSIDYIVIDNGIQIAGAGVIQSKDILGIGGYALTIESDSAIKDISKIPAAIDLLHKNIQVKGAKVLTRKGRLIGEIGDFYFDESKNCKITGLEYIADKNDRNIRIIPSEKVITFGRNLIVVTEDVENALTDNLEQQGLSDRVSDSGRKRQTHSDVTVPKVHPIHEEPSSRNIENTIVDDIVGKADDIIANEGDTFFRETETKQTPNQINEAAIEKLKENNAEIKGNLINGGYQIARVDVPSNNDNHSGNVIKNAPQTKNSAHSLFEQRQKQYLNGRKATKTIFDSFGGIIINDGDLINNDIIDLAKQNGKLIELVMNNRA